SEHVPELVPSDEMGTTPKEAKARCESLLESLRRQKQTPAGQYQIACIEQHLAEFGPLLKAQEQFETAYKEFETAYRDFVRHSEDGASLLHFFGFVGGGLLASAVGTPALGFAMWSGYAGSLLRRG